MGLRETINRYPVPSAAAAGGLIVVAVVVIVWAGRPKQTVLLGASEKVFYTVDDGATWFADSPDKIPPFKKDGKDAVRAYVFRDADGKEFVSHLERYTPEARRALEAWAGLPPAQRALEDRSIAAGGPDGVEVKRPKGTSWVRSSEPRAQKILQPVSPSGKTDGLTYVEPR